MTRPEHTVAIAIVVRDGRYLVARRRADAHLGGLWEFPGGKVHAGETVSEAAVRELAEECAVRAVPQSVLGTIRCEYADRVVYLVPVICVWSSGDGEALASDECRWVDADGLRRLEMPAINSEIIRAALRALG
jgi:8-oxo-dGTP diphosphatase